MNGNGKDETHLPAELSERADFARILLDAHMDGIALIRPDGTIIHANATMARWLGRPNGEVMGTPLWHLYPSDQVDHRRIVIGGVVHTGIAARFTDKSGDQWHETLIQPISGAEGNVDKIAIYVRDVTRQVEAEERLKRTSLQLITTQEDERRRIAQDLHDDIGQHMTALLLSLRAVETGIKAGQQGMGAQIKDAIHSVESMMKQVRQILYQLRPPLLATVPLSNVLDALCTSFAGSSGLNVDFSSDENLPPIPEIPATVLYRFVQEGLNNAAKHAEATSVWVNLDCMDGEVSLSLEDDGHGFDPDQPLELGLGLQGIRDRFSMLSGSFAVESAPGKGTRLYGSLPLANYSP